MKRRTVAVLLLAQLGAAPAQSTSPPAYVTTGIFIGAIEEGARIFTPVRLLPFDHPEALGHQFPTVQQLHRNEDRLLILIGQHAGLRLGTTLQRYPTEPDTLWPYTTFQSPPLAAFQSVLPITRPAADSPLPGLRAAAFIDRFPLAFIVDTRGMTLAERHMQQATAMGLDVSRAQFIDALRDAAQRVPATGAAILVYQSPTTPVGTWRGTSVCLVHPSACKDEVVVYRIARMKVADSLTVDARKIVGGEEQEMGVLSCRFTSPNGLTCAIPHGTWLFRVRSDSLIGELRLPDNTKFRDVRAARAPTTY